MMNEPSQETVLKECEQAIRTIKHRIELSNDKDCEDRWEHDVTWRAMKITSLQMYLAVIQAIIDKWEWDKSKVIPWFRGQLDKYWNLGKV